MTNAGIFDVILCQFRYWHKPSLMLLFEIDKNLEISLHNNVLLFSLVVSL